MSAGPEISAAHNTRPVTEKDGSTRAYTRYATYYTIVKETIPTSK